jgi:hypothetical protein
LVLSRSVSRSCAPKGLGGTAQGWRAAPTLGAERAVVPTPQGVVPPTQNPFRVGFAPRRVSQGRRCAPTLGYAAEPLRGKPRSAAAHRHEQSPNSDQTETRPPASSSREQGTANREQRTGHRTGDDGRQCDD